MRLYFLGLFSGYSIILYKKVPRKKTLYSLKCMGTKDVNNHGNKGLTSKTPLAILNMQMQRKKSFLWKRLRIDFIFPRLRTFFVRDLNSCDIIFRDYIGSPHIILGKKSQEVKTLLPVSFCPRTSENWYFITKVFISRFFSIYFCSCDFLT